MTDERGAGTVGGVAVVAVRVVVLVALVAVLVACAEPEPEPPQIQWDCVLEPGADPDFALQIGCDADFDQLASDPLSASVPGARSVKTVMDRIDGDALYFQNSERFPIHWAFASSALSGGDLPVVPQLNQFNQTEYTSPDRRFVLGAVTYYEGPAVWAYEIAPYDTADIGMIELAFRSIASETFFGTELHFHPTSDAIIDRADGLPADIPIVTTEELYAGTDYQPLNLASSMGQLRFYSEQEMEDALPNFREIVVLEAVPNDIAVVAGIVTEQFQTPLSHINVLSQNRGTPNMGLRGAFDLPVLRALDGLWVELTVGALDWSVREVTREEADAWWEANRPEPLDTRPMDLAVRDLRNDEDIVDFGVGDLAESITASVPAFGGKASHFGAMSTIDGLPHPDAFAIPVAYYNDHMVAAGLWPEVELMLADTAFHEDAAVRAERLGLLRDAIQAAPIDPDFLQLVMDKLNAEYPGLRVRFRSSTNAEDVSGFNGAGLYTSKSGDPNDPAYPVDEAIKQVWASVWRYRAYEERQYYGIDHRQIGMALLVHRSFPDEDANGVAVTGNVFDASGLDPAFFVNVQEGEESVVLPDPGVTTDQYLHYFTQAGQPVVYLAHSSEVPDGETVLTRAEVEEVGQALQAIHTFFYPAYGAGGGFYAMDVEFKFDSSETGESQLTVKQARPYPGRGS